MKDPAFAKFVLLVNGAVPLAMMCWDAYHHHLGANPVNSAIHITGMTAIIFLLLSLTVTPARLISGWNWLSHFRRMLGLYAFFYASIHLILYMAFQQGFNLGRIVSDVFKNWFILFGMTAVLLMVPLAITSTNGMIKRLGAAKWKRLHQLVYISAIAAVIHFIMSFKVVMPLPVTFAVILGLLFAYRILVKQLPFLRRRKTVASRVD